MTGDRAFETLREAVRLSPENIPLRRHLAESLLAQGRPELAEAEFREALTLAPEDVAPQGRTGQRVPPAGQEQPGRRHPRRRWPSGPDAPPMAFVLYARLLAAAGEVEEAVRQYHRGVKCRPGRRRPRVRRSAGDQLRRPTADESTRRRFDDEVVEGRVRSAWGEPAQSSTIEVDRPEPHVQPTSAGWSRSRKRSGSRSSIPMNHPELYRAYGKSIGGGILLYGPPGCGKTYLARATAGEIHAAFLAVGINDVLEMWIGNSERNLHALFEQARQNTPCVLFFDEVDALAASRADLAPAAGASSSTSSWPSSTGSRAATKAS